MMFVSCLVLAPAQSPQHDYEGFYLSLAHFAMADGHEHSRMLPWARQVDPAVRWAEKFHMLLLPSTADDKTFSDRLQPSVRPFMRDLHEALFFSRRPDTAIALNIMRQFVGSLRLNFSWLILHAPHRLILYRVCAAPQPLNVLRNSQRLRPCHPRCWCTRCAPSSTVRTTAKSTSSAASTKRCPMRRPWLRSRICVFAPTAPVCRSLVRY